MRTKELFAFIKERHAVYTRRAAGAPRPWTKDPILQRYRFCNVYRELDAVTVWINENWRTPNADDPDVWFAITLARFFNLPASLAAVGYPVPFSPDRVERALQKYKLAKGGVFNAAYMVRSDPGDKITYVVRKVLTPLWRDRAALRPRAGDNLELFYRRLLPYYGMGSFMVAQVIADVKFVPPLKAAQDWWTWAAPGPGSLRGLNRVLERGPNARLYADEWIMQLGVLQTKITPLVAQAGMPRISAQDLQNCLCEWDKYERARLGEGRPKQLYPGV